MLITLWTSEESSLIEQKRCLHHKVLNVDQNIHDIILFKFAGLDNRIPTIKYSFDTKIVVQNYIFKDEQDNSLCRTNYT
ncbi:unnamed protein product [Rotaria sp. Silwood1]|nr:unnamed protein product [Rotaria sp. Silwood1]